jgi:ParB family chromosome partitioning protein
MVDANFQREDTLPSEKARAYKMKMDALTHQGKCADSKVTSAKQIGQMAGISDRQVQRYIRLTELIPELSKMVDDKKITFMFGVEISFLKEEYQQLVYKNISKGKKVSKDKLRWLRKIRTTCQLKRLSNCCLRKKKIRRKRYVP